MPDAVFTRPTPDEYAPYFARYIALVPPGDLVAAYEGQLRTFPALLERIGDEYSTQRTAPGKWNIREVVGHLADTERVFGYRATQFSRGDARALPSFDQDAWIAIGGHADRLLPDLVSEWSAARRSTIALLRGLPRAALARQGVASDMTFSVLALLCVIPGHVEHHVARLREDHPAVFA